MKHSTGYGAKPSFLAQRLELVADLRRRAEGGNGAAELRLHRYCREGMLRPYWEGGRR